MKKDSFFSVLRRIYSPLYLHRNAKFHNLGQRAFPFCPNAKKIGNEKSLANVFLFSILSIDKTNTQMNYIFL